MTVFELATRVPLIIHAPHASGSWGQGTQAIVELVDLLPSLAELAGVDPVNVSAPGEAPLGGVSFASVFNMTAKERARMDVIKPYALSQHARCWKDTHTPCGTTYTDAQAHEQHSGSVGKVQSSIGANPMSGSGSGSFVGGKNASAATGAFPVQLKKGPHSLHDMCDCHMVDAPDIDFMGLSIRVPGWRYTEWHPWNGTLLKPVWSSQVGRELYSHNNDTGFGTSSFDNFENHNLAEDAAHSAEVESLSKQLRLAFDTEHMDMGDARLASGLSGDIDN